MIVNNSVQEFQQITKYPLENYLQDFVAFVQEQKIDIFNYYSGSATQPKQESFHVLDTLLNESIKLNDVMELNKNRLIHGKFWELVDTLSDIQTSLWTVENTSKWIRSAITKNNFSPNVNVDKMLSQYQTIENLATSFGYTNADNEWSIIALRNDLTEEQYTPNGGEQLFIGYIGPQTIKLNSVVDNIQGKKVYGIDVQKKISFAENDLVALSYDDTMTQTVEILANLRQGDTPEFPQDGFQSDLVVGTNRNSIAYPVLFRQYYATFQKDDSLQALKVVDIDITNDGLFLSFEVLTRLQEIIPKQITL